MKDEVDRMRRNLQKGRKTPTPISTYARHLYAKKGVLSLEEQDEYDKLLKIQSYGAANLGSEESEEKEDTDDTEDSSSPIMH